jgi:hypothetical protein
MPMPASQGTQANYAKSGHGQDQDCQESGERVVRKVNAEAKLQPGHSQHCNERNEKCKQVEPLAHVRHPALCGPRPQFSNYKQRIHHQVSFHH